MPAESFSISVTRCGTEPVDTSAADSLPDPDFAESTSSLRDFTGDLGIDDEDDRAFVRQDDRRQILFRIIGQVGIETAADGYRPRRRHSYDISIRGRLRDKVGAEISIRAGAVVDKDLLIELSAELVGNPAGGDVGAAAGRIRNDQPDRAVWIVLREGRPIYTEAENGARGKNDCDRRLQESRFGRCFLRSSRMARQHVFQILVASKAGLPVNIFA